MQSRTKKVWHPERSLALYDGCEESGRGSSKALPSAAETEAAEVKRKGTRIPRRSVPTVDVAAGAASQKRECGKEVGGGAQTYSTIEQTNYSTVLESFPEPAKRARYESDHCPNFCGWLEDEPLTRYSKVASVCIDRTGLRTPAEGNRGAVQSRPSSRYSSAGAGRRQGHYDFRHFLDDTHEYIEHYRKFYCYTTLTVPPQRTSTIAEGEEEIQQDPDNFLPLGVKSLYQGDPYLRELASRLGVRESIREQQLLRSPRPTPPSIVKKNRERADLIICANSKKDPEEDTQKSSCEKTPAESSFQAPNQDSCKASRPSSRSVNSKPAPLELPKIAQVTHPRHHTNSVISVAKYLQITSHHQPDSLNNKDTTNSSQHSLHEVACSASGSSISEDIISEHFRNEVSSSYLLEGQADVLPKNVQILLQNQLPLVDEIQKEKLISSKAQALGLLSRDWSKTPHVRRLFGTYAQDDRDSSDASHTYSRPCTRRATSSRMNQEHTSTEETHQLAVAKKDPRPKMSQEKAKCKGNPKLERLKSIYKQGELPKRKKTIPNRLPPTKNHRCESRAFSRPATRFSHWDREMGDIKELYSRPATRFSRSRSLESRAEARLPKATAKETTDINSIEEDSYWNELPRSSQTRPTTTTKQEWKHFEDGNVARNEPPRAIQTRPTRQEQKNLKDSSVAGNELPRGTQTRPTTTAKQERRHFENGSVAGNELPRATQTRPTTTTKRVWKHFEDGNVAGIRATQMTRQSSQPLNTHGQSNVSRPVTGAVNQPHNTGYESIHHPLTMRLRKPPQSKVRTTADRHHMVVDSIAPGSTQQQISEHLARMRKKLDGVLDIQQRKLIPT